jgi:hypothetical protein
MLVFQTEKVPDEPKTEKQKIYVSIGPINHYGTSSLTHTVTTQLTASSETSLRQDIGRYPIPNFDPKGR